jgi:putative DNA primase/helicase
LWDGKRWCLDETGRVNLLAESTAKSIAEEAARETDRTLTNQLLDWSKNSLQRQRLSNMLALAQSHLPVTPDQFDADPWLLNVENGTINLKTGDLEVHSQSHHITKMAPVVYDPDAKCPLWEKTVSTILGGDEDLIRYMQKVIGYSITGDTKEKCFFILHGSGDNGKTLFVNAVMAVLGEYASSTGMETFIVSLPGAPSNDIMRLKGARLAMASEAERQFQLAEAKIKRLTGGDMCTARLLYREPIDFYPQFKIFLLTNQIPRFSVTDIALMNRIHLIPFGVTIPKEKQDKDLLDKLKLEASGILNWAITGCLLWQAEGLNPPSAVVAALEDHRLEVDVIGRFIEECCVLESVSRVGVTQLHNAYSDWASQNDIDTIGRKGFTTALLARGFKKDRCSGAIMWSGIRIVVPTE